MSTSNRILQRLALVDECLPLLSSFLFLSCPSPPRYLINNCLLSIHFLQMVTQRESSFIETHLLPIMNLFSLHFPLEENGRIQLCRRNDETDSSNSTNDEATIASHNSEFIDLSSCVRDTKISIPTLNG